MNNKQKEAEELVREYVGQDLCAIGKRIPEISRYNNNFYKLPNGVIVLMENDDEGFNQVSVEVDGSRYYVGGQYDDDEFYIGQCS